MAHDAEVTPIPPTTEPATRSAAAERTRRYRQRRRSGLRCLTIQLRETEIDVLVCKVHNQTVPQQIPVSWTQCNYGGSRPWLHCLCGRRVARLFKGLGGYYCRPVLRGPSL
jgi:hypothetical protein